MKYLSILIIVAIETATLLISPTLWAATDSHTDIANNSSPTTVAIDSNTTAPNSHTTVASNPNTPVKNSSQGLKYQKITTEYDQIVHVLEIDPEFLNVSLVHAKNYALGRETVEDIAKKHQAIAAVNGGFFHGGILKDGLPAGILKIDNRWYGIAYKPRAAIGWSSKKNKVLIDRLQTKTTLIVNKVAYPVHNLNQPASERKAVLYTDTYDETADNIPGGRDVVIQNGKVIKIIASDNTPIPKGGYVYVIGPKSHLAKLDIKPGDKAEVRIDILPHFKKGKIQDWHDAQYIVGGIPILVRDGKIQKDHSMEKTNRKFVSDRHARTSIGIKKNGHWIFVVVEKNSGGDGSPGMKISELAALMQKLGCQDALNMDGGGSSTLYLKDGVVNNPEGDYDEDLGVRVARKVSDAILITPK